MENKSLSLRNKIVSLLSFFFSKEVLAALIGALVLIWGYTYNFNKQQDLEKLKIKASAYSTFLSEIPTGTNINDANRVFSLLYIYAPDCVVRKINNSFKYNGDVATINENTMREIKLILHNDINNPKICDINGNLTSGDFITVVSDYRGKAQNNSVSQ